MACTLRSVKGLGFKRAIHMRISDSCIPFGKYENIWLGLRVLMETRVKVNSECLSNRPYQGRARPFIYVLHIPPDNFF